MPKRFEGDRGPIGDRLWELRSETGKTITQVSRECGLTETTVCWLEIGRIKDPRGLTLSVLADYYGVSMDYLYGRTDNRRMAR